MSTRFERHVQRQVLEFLQTVLLIDDEAFRRAPQSASNSTENDEEWSDKTAGGDARRQFFELQTPADIPAPDELDVQEVTFCFASEGLSCAILSPQTAQENNQFKPAFVKTAKRADALLLDWNMNEDNGKTAERLIQAVLKEDSKSPRRRLRLITIYTGEPDLQKIAERVEKATEESLSGDATSWDDPRKVAFSRGPVRVAVFAKEHVQNLSSQLEDRRKKVSALPKIVVEEFSRHSMGLVTSASLSALAGIRNDAHRVIVALRPELDAAILGQRVALPHPEDVERQVEELIVAEIQAIIQDHEVGSHVGVARIKDWLAHHKHLAPCGISEVSEVSKELRIKLLSDGFGDEVITALKELKVSNKRLEQLRKTSGTALFTQSEQEMLNSDRLFATRMSLRNRYSRPTPVLQLGSIVERDGSYAVCVQPLCDSVRINGARTFPFLPLEVANEGDGVPGDGLLTITDDRAPGEYVRLRVRAKPASIKMEDFKASEAGVVRARPYRDVSRFRPTTGKSWRWVGDLKADHAQRVVEKLSAGFSRVGLEEAEVLRQGL